MNERQWIRIGNTILNLDEVSGIDKNSDGIITVYLNNGKIIEVWGDGFDDLWEKLKEM